MTAEEAGIQNYGHVSRWVLIIHLKRDKRLLLQQNAINSESSG